MSNFIKRLILLSLFMFFAPLLITAATFTVTRSDDRDATCNSGVDCSLREAVNAANGSATNDTIDFTQGLATISLTSEIVMTNNGTLTINGPGANILTILGSTLPNTYKRIFYTASAIVQITGITLKGGGGRGLGSIDGGAIFVNAGTLKLDNVYLRDNTPIQLIGYGAGGAIYFNGGANHLILNSTFYRNEARIGGGICSNGASVSIANSTFSSNAALGGGGIYNTGTLILRNVSITKNGILQSLTGAGGGIAQDGGEINFGNTIIADNRSTGLGNPDEIDFRAGIFISVGHNLVGDRAGGSTNTRNPITFQSTDIRDTAPLLGAVGMNGGAIPTHALLLGSPAIDSGSNVLAVNPLDNLPLAVDQRGLKRIADGDNNGSQIVDIGSYEFRSTQVGCSYSIGSTNQSFPSTGGTGSFTITTTSSCAWEAQSDSWITLTNGNGTGNGTIQFTVQPNPGSARTGTIWVGGRIFTINQASGCTFSISPTSVNVTASGGTGSTNVTSFTGCAWTAVSNDPWISITAGNSGAGNGTVSYNVQSTNGSARTGTITIGTQTFTVNQAASCNYSLDPSSASMPSGGGGGSFSLSVSTSSCAWTAVSNNAWITVTGGSAGTGNGNVSFTVAANTGPARTGTITAGNQTFTVNQANGCAYSLSSSNTTVPASGGTGGFNVTTVSGCMWTAISNAPWLTITSGSGGTGNLTVNYSVQANNGLARTGQINVNGQTFTLNQLARPNLRTRFDFNGDGRADYSVFRPSTNKWWILHSSDFSLVEKIFAIPGDVVAPADYNGDGKTDIGIFRPSSGDWWYLSSIDNTSQVNVHFGANGDVPRPSDFDGDGKADYIVFRPSNSVWYRLGSTGVVSVTAFGIAGDKPLVGDFDGDGKSDLCIYRPSTGTWWYLSSIDGSQRATQFGISSDTPVPADYDGDGKTDLAVYRPSTGVWYILNSSNGLATIVPFGLAEDKPVPADYDGDGRADIAVFRPSSGLWYLLRSTEGFGAINWGINTDMPIPNAYIVP